MTPPKTLVKTRDPIRSETLAETLYGQIAPAARSVTPRRRRLAGLTAGALALSVVLTSAMPVRAGNNDDLLAALAALAVIGVIISEAEKDKAVPPVAQYQPPQYQPPQYQPALPPLPYPANPAQSVGIPEACAIEVERRDRRGVVVYGESCLRRYGIDHLPQGCAREVKAYGRKDWVYGEACLREAGYRIDSDFYYSR